MRLDSGPTVRAPGDRCRAGRALPRRRAAGEAAESPWWRSRRRRAPERRGPRRVGRLPRHGDADDRQAARRRAAHGAGAERGRGRAPAAAWRRRPGAADAGLPSTCTCVAASGTLRCRERPSTDEQPPDGGDAGLTTEAREEKASEQSRPPDIERAGRADAGRGPEPPDAAAARGGRRARPEPGRLPRRLRRRWRRRRRAGEGDPQGPDRRPPQLLELAVLHRRGKSATLNIREASTAPRSSTPRRSTTTTSSSARCARSSRRATRAAATCSSSPTGWRAA